MTKKGVLDRDRDQSRKTSLCYRKKMSAGNSTSAVGKPTDWATNLRTMSLVIYCVIFIVGTVGNGLVIYVTGFRMKQTVNSVWFLNLAIADFLFTTFLVFSIISVSQSYQWNLGRFMCKLNTFVIVVNMFASVFLLLAISVDRCLSTWVVVWAQNKRTVLKTQLICLIIWIIAMGCSTPYAIFRDTTKINSIRCGYSNSTTNEHIVSLSFFRFVMGFLVPFLGIFLSYVAIYVRTKRLQKTRRSRRIIMSVILAFFICWLPFHIFVMIELFSKNKQVVATVGHVGVSLAFLNSCLNPILYVFMCDEFQKKLKQSICHVLESALADEHLSSSRKLSAHFSRVSR